MCGIVGLARWDGSAERAGELVEAMAERIRHRGPDGGGIAAHPDATVGMVRLAIVDVVHGVQPMTSDDGMIVLVYNGEIYNAPALRSELEARGIRFRTRSDTEVILRLYELDPDRVEELLVGMWGFAIHDRRRRRLVLSRDRFGMKPLFLAEAGGAFAFASELRAFDRQLAPFASRFEVDADAAHAMLSWSYVPEDATIYRGVRRIPPASRLTIDLATGASSSRTYWTLTPSTDAAAIGSIDEACERVESMLRRAVKEHLESDVPIATFLSGGIDSSLVTAYASELSGAPLHAYTIGFAEPHFDESPFARETAKMLGVPIHVEQLDESKARAKLADALLAYDEPFGDSSSLATYLLTQHVGRDFKVALGGDGGDEVFAGYKKYAIIRFRRPFHHAPAMRDALGTVLGRIPVRHDRTTRFSEVLRTVRRVARGLTGSPAHVYTQLTQVAALTYTSRLMHPSTSSARFEEQARRRFETSLGSELQKTLAADLGSMLANDMLVKVDRASMANSLEARVPFLDHRIVELGVGLPERFTLGSGAVVQGKRVLRTLHERRFGTALARRKKRGFGVPVEKWLRGPFDAACEQLFARARLERFGLLAPAELSDGGFRRWAETDPWLLWHAFALASWCEATLGDGPDALRALLATEASS